MLCYLSVSCGRGLRVRGTTSTGGSGTRWESRMPLSLQKCSIIYTQMGTPGWRAGLERAGHAQASPRNSRPATANNSVFPLQVEVYIIPKSLEKALFYFDCKKEVVNRFNSPPKSTAWICGAAEIAVVLGGPCSLPACSCTSALGCFKSPLPQPTEAPVTDRARLS